MKLMTMIILSVLSALAPVAGAQGVFELDLAAFEEATEVVDPGEPFSIRIINRLPVRYSYTIERKTVILPPLPANLIPPAAAGATACENVPLDLQTKLGQATDEQGVADAVARALVAVAGCSAAEKQVLEDFIEVATTKTFPQQRPLAEGESLTFTLTRGTGDAKKTWKLTVNTPAPGEWRLLYGFNFVPNRDRTYFLRQNEADETKFDIVRENDNDELSLVPTIFATWLSRKARLSGTGYGWSGGLGFESADPIVFAGWTYMYHENLSFNIGAVMAKQRRLNSRLDMNTPVGENLSEEQLHSSGYRPNIFLGIGFRFDENPFKKAPEDEEDDEE